MTYAEWQAKMAQETSVMVNITTTEGMWHVATEAERERCALIADAEAKRAFNTRKEWLTESSARKIASEIRKGDK
jgi:hypothetical protein